MRPALIIHHLNTASFLYQAGDVKGAISELASAANYANVKMPARNIEMMGNPTMIFVQEALRKYYYESGNTISLAIRNVLNKYSAGSGITFDKEEVKKKIDPAQEDQWFDKAVSV